MNSKLGDYIERVREIVPYNKEIPVKGLSIEKCFIKTKVSNLQNLIVPFQLVREKYFCYKASTDRNGDKLSIAYNNLQQTIQVSSIYIVFKIIKKNLLDREYLDLFFKQSWINKFARYYSIGTVREMFNWKDFSKLPIYVPSMKIQRKIVDRYNYLEKIIRLKSEMNTKLEQWMQSFFHFLFDEVKEINNETFGNLFQIISGLTLSKTNSYWERLYFCKEGGTPFLRSKDINMNDFKFIFSASDMLTKEGEYKCGGGG